MSACRSCHAPVEWVKNVATGKRMPVDPDPVPGGNVEITDGGARIVTPDPSRVLHVSHFSTCPDAEQWRRR